MVDQSISGNFILYMKWDYKMNKEFNYNEAIGTEKEKEIITYDTYLLIKSVINIGVRYGIDLVHEHLAKEIDAIDDECEARNVSVIQVLEDWKGVYINE